MFKYDLTVEDESCTVWELSNAKFSNELRIGDLIQLELNYQCERDAVPVLKKVRCIVNKIYYAEGYTKKDEWEFDTKIEASITHIWGKQTINKNEYFDYLPIGIFEYKRLADISTSYPEQINEEED